MFIRKIQTYGKTHWISLLVLFFSMVFGGVMAVRMGQDANWDLLNYHYYNPYAFFNNRLTHDLAPAHIQTYLNPFLDIPPYLLAKYLPAIWVGGILGAIQGINIWLLYLIGCVLFKPIKGFWKHFICIVLAFVGFWGPASISELGGMFGDNIVSLFVLGALLLFIQYFTENISNDTPNKWFSKKLLWGGLLIGIAFGLKITLIIYLIPLVLAFIVLAFIRKIPMRYVIFTFLFIGIGTILTLGYWSYVLYTNFDNPLFPYYNGIFHSPYYVDANVTDKRFLPRTLMHTLFYPFYFIKSQNLVSELMFRDIRLAFAYASIVVLVGWEGIRLVYSYLGDFSINIKRKLVENKSFLYLTIFVIVSYIIWLKLFSIYRYAIVLEYLAPILIIGILAYILPFKRIVVPFTLCFCTVALWYMQPLNWGRVPYGDNFISVEVPYTNELDNAIVLMTGMSPNAYIIPKFPNSTQFLRIESLLSTPGSNKNIDQRIHDALVARQEVQKFALMDISDDFNRINNVVGHYGFMVETDTCIPVRTNLAINEQLCKLSVKQAT